MTVSATAAEAALAELLAGAKLDRPLPEVTALLDGIAAAPPTPEGFTGITLLGGLEPGLRVGLSEFVAATAQRFAEDVERPTAVPERVAALRAELKRQQLDGFIVPLNDEYHGEYVPRRAQRLSWLTGFTGSAGVALVLADRAAFFTDGRYTLQAREQVDAGLFSFHHSGEEPPHDWLARTLGPGKRFGYDPWLHTLDGLGRLRQACELAGSELVATARNPVDAVWPGQPPAPLSPVRALALDYAGEAAAEKRGRLAHDLGQSGLAAVVLTLPESIAWLLNIRGGDVPHTPLPLGFALLHDDAKVDLFIDGRKLDRKVAEHLGNAVSVHALADFGPALDRLASGGKPVQVDRATASAWVIERLQAAGAKLRFADDPCLLPKACKNPVELAGSRNAHRRDGAAVVRFLAWLEQAAGKHAVDEILAAEKLYGFRRQNPLFQDLSFTTISGAGPNGAIVHYRVTAASNRKLEPGTLYLVDSGAQYLDGTTDITRTVAIGAPTAEMRDRFTRVLKGHIALATCRFPIGTTGAQLDVLARHALWQVGLDYDHGTGHGVGSYLSVHEGPQRISKVGSTVPLRPGMIVSNEPGYYKTGAYGIRIENLVTVVPVPMPPGGERQLLGFETLTKAPIDRHAIDLALLSASDAAWLDQYHAGVRESLTPLLDADTAAWLAEATRPLGP